jgi:hypothetical protein
MYRITSRFGQQESFRTTGHSGIDFAMEKGEPIRSIKEGIVTVRDYGNFNAGKTVMVKWEDGKTAIYGHLNDFSVKDGQHVQAGDLLGHAGNTGHSFGNHLHFGLKENGRFIDPSPYIEDIQNMNVKQFVQHIPEPSQVKMNFFDYMNEHMHSIGQLKLQFISNLTNDTFFIQISKQLLQFVSSHSSFLNDIIACII